MEPMKIIEGNIVMKPQEVNYKSDFDFYLPLLVCTGIDRYGRRTFKDIGFPEWDWTARFNTSRSTKPFVASSRGGVLTNCMNDDGRIRIIADAHGLMPGDLTVDFTAEIPDAVYPDGLRTLAMPSELSIRLVTEAVPCPYTLEAELVLPMIKGEPFTFDDFTAEQIADLRRPADDAAAELRESADRIKLRLFDDMFSSAAGIWGKIDHEHMENGKAAPYYLNGLWLTYEEAMEIFIAGPLLGDAQEVYGFNKNIRTNLPAQRNSASGYRFRSRIFFTDFSKGMEVVNLNPFNKEEEVSVATILDSEGATAWSDFTFTSRIYLGILNVSMVQKAKLWSQVGGDICEQLYIKGLKVRCDFRSMRSLRLDCWQYLIANAANGTNPITITVHPEVYAKLTDVSNVEWHQVLLDAAEKQITFMTAE